ncbi:MAG TPA: polyphenol oxidase family protein [Acidimicrobiales bacterium]|nr:polyphenol oxidase family protein [Acidimicrobiales bacterium]
MQPLSVEVAAWRVTGGIEVMTWPAFDALGVDVVMTTRQGGVSAGVYESLNLSLHVGDDDTLVIENRRRAARAIGASLDDLVFCNQTHGRGVAVVTASDRGRGTTTLGTALDAVDALVTADVGPVLAMMVADCVPIALYSPLAHVAGAVHSGWRGTLLRVAEAAVQAMVGLGAKADEIVAAIGPAIHPDRYQVGAEVMEEARECFGGQTDDLLRPDPDGPAGTYLFDLWRANQRVLVEAGVRPERVLLAGVPSGGVSFFSDRAARPCGRNSILVRLNPLS